MGRPAIPKSMKKEVRKKCFNGCVICGGPIIEYEHIVPWSQVKEHTLVNITLLCPNHHSQVTKGLIPKEVVISKTKIPFNSNKETSSNHLLYYSGDKFRILLGTNLFEEKKVVNGIRNIIGINNNTMMSVEFQDNHLLFNICFFEEDKLFFEINNNELKFNVKNYDVEFIQNRLTVRNNRNKIVLLVHFEVPNTLRIEKLETKFQGEQISVQDGCLIINGLAMSESKISCNGGYAISI